jgi:hypothetical protein
VLCTRNAPDDDQGQLRQWLFPLCVAGATAQELTGSNQSEGNEDEHPDGSTRPRERRAAIERDFCICRPGRGDGA